MDRRARRFRAEVRRLGQRGRGRRYPAPLRGEAVAYLRERQAAGAKVAQAATELGLRKATLHGWAEAEPAVGFVPVVVEGAPPRIVVHGPGGLRIEGLDLGALADLLRRLA